MMQLLFTIPHDSAMQSHAPDVDYHRQTASMIEHLWYSSAV
ncbi:MAG TPA: hypothetical protein VNN55_00385 [bacterium]|nr:hypothetical protein [bacterium]